jgi:CBS domain containing-hemolysin-like protein
MAAIELLVVFLVVCVNGFFALAEFAFVSSSTNMAASRAS